MHVYVFTYKASGNTVGMSARCGSQDRYSKQAKASPTSDTLHKGNTCSGSSRKTYGRKKKSPILIVLKCHKYAPTVLIFYGNRKSIEWHQNQPPPKPTRTPFTQEGSKCFSTRNCRKYSHTFTQIVGITRDVTAIQGQLEKGTNYINTNLQIYIYIFQSYGAILRE
jgi:hypothetical protein